ncbi:MAG: mechanosensitive ion channel family protein [Anaerolineae bacterium]|nr:mechanosensitive ion channel family protein [Anaerolineae bacterium]MDQ7035132.1 mechanosensitive ion channel family protein [Anaerolineae bacterium]
MSIAEQLPFLSELPAEVQMIVLNLILVLLALVVVWVLRNLVTRLVMIPIRGLAGRTKTDLDDRMLDSIERPMRLFVLGAGVAIVTTIFTFTPQLDSFTNSVARALILAGIVFFVYNLVDMIGFDSKTVRRVTGLSIEERLLPFMRTVVKVFIVVMGALIIIQEFGYDVTGLIASFGIVGLALSLAAKDTAANIFGFTAIVSDNPFKVGDFIVTSDFSGTVEHVGVRSTRVRKLDQSLVSVPNSQLTDSAVTNWSRLSKRRLDFYIGLTYDTTASQMRELLQQLKDMLKAREHIDVNSVQVFFTEFADSALNVRIIAYFLLDDWGTFTAQVEDINLDIMEIVEALGLGFAFPSQSLYIESLPERNGKTPIASQTSNIRVQRADQTDLSDAEEIGKSEETYQDNPSASNEGGDDGGGE